MEQKNKVVFDYDRLNDSLYISQKDKGDKVKGSVVIGNLVIDFTPRGKIVGLEIIGISKYLDHRYINSNSLNADGNKNNKKVKWNGK